MNGVSFTRTISPRESKWKWEIKLLMEECKVNIVMTANEVLRYDINI